MSLTIAYITSRKEPHFEWFVDSLARQVPSDCELRIILVCQGSLISHGDPELNGHLNAKLLETPPKPTIWQGKYRITKEDWWAKSNALNTAICLCETSHIAFVDDRCVLSPAWIHCVEESIAGNYAVCGNYEKRANMVVKDGEIIEMGQLLGADTRTQAGYPYATKDLYGGSYALPLEWCLSVNGHPEICDGLGLEDAMFGCLLHNSGFPIFYDSRMLILEDRTPGQLDGGLKRADKGVSPLDKSHAIVERLRNSNTSQNSYDILALRDHVLAGNPFPPPTASHLDWWDGQPISEM